MATKTRVLCSSDLLGYSLGKLTFWTLNGLGLVGGASWAQQHLTSE